MSDFTPLALPAFASLAQLRKQAKELLREYRAAGSNEVTLSDAQFDLARRYGFDSWAKLKEHLEAAGRPRAERYESLAEDLLSACLGDAAALVRVNEAFGNSLTTEALRAKVGERPGAVALPHAQVFLARQHGYKTWAKLIGGLTAAGPASSPQYRIDWKENTIEPGPIISAVIGTSCSPL